LYCFGYFPISPKKVAGWEKKGDFHFIPKKLEDWFEAKIALLSYPSVLQVLCTSVGQVSEISNITEIYHAQNLKA
jgi:hypothetical protein